MLYEHLVPALHGAIDQRAEFQLASEQFGHLIVQGKPAFRKVLQRGLAKLVARNPIGPDELINVLTLMDPVQFLEGGDDEIVGHEFSIALRALRLSDFDECDRGYCEMLEKMIWRRCMIRDNWEAINEIGQKGTKEVESEIRKTSLFQTLAECIKGNSFLQCSSLAPH
jgi:nuclear pore complex protein Nup133